MEGLQAVHRTVAEEGTFMARRPAMKNVLSPISDRKISAKAARKPDFPRAELAAQSCTALKILLV